jgi:hypothetical protein
MDLVSHRASVATRYSPSLGATIPRFGAVSSIMMESRWPPPRPEPTWIPTAWFAASAFSACVAGAFVSNPPLNAVLLAMSIIPVGFWITDWRYTKRIRFEVEQSLAIHREGATALMGGDAFLHVDEHQQFLVCTLRDGTYTRLELAEISELPRLNPDNICQLKLVQNSGASVTIAFPVPRDAEAWRWRLLHLVPRLGLEVERLRAVDLFGSGKAHTSRDWRDWGEPNHARTSPESPLFQAVSPEFAEALASAVKKDNEPFQPRPAGLAMALPHLLVTPTPLAQTPRPKSEPPVTSSGFRKGMLVASGGSLLAGLATLLIHWGWSSWELAASVLFFGPMAVALFYGVNRTHQLSQAGLQPARLMELGTQKALEQGVFFVIPPDQDLAYISIVDRTMTVPVRAIKSLRRTVQHRVTCLEVLHDEPLHIPCASPRDFESVYTQWLHGLAIHPQYHGEPAPPLVTIMLEGGMVSAVGRMKLRETWLDLTAVPAGQDLPIGPLVGPVTPDFASRVMKIIHASGGIATSVPYRETDPCPLCPAPGGPAIHALAKHQANHSPPPTK